MDDTARELEILLARIETAIDQHQKQSRHPDPREVERLQRWRRELLLQLADSNSNNSENQTSFFK